MKTSIGDSLIIAGAGILLLFLKALGLITKKFIPILERAELRRSFRNDMYKWKCKKLHDESFFYYLDLMRTKPHLLAYDLASKDLNELKRKNRVEKMYARKFVKQYAKNER